MLACDNSDDAIAIALVNAGAIYNFPPMVRLLGECYHLALANKTKHICLDWAK